MLNEQSFIQSTPLKNAAELGARSGTLFRDRVLVNRVQDLSQLLAPKQRSVLRRLNRLALALTLGDSDHDGIDVAAVLYLPRIHFDSFGCVFRGYKSQRRNRRMSAELSKNTAYYVADRVSEQTCGAVRVGAKLQTSSMVSVESAINATDLERAQHR